MIRNIKIVWVKFKLLDRWKQALLLGFLIIILISSVSTPIDNKEINIQSVTKIPRIEGSTDGILKKIVKDFYNQNIENPWWNRIKVIEEGLASGEFKKMIYIKTDYQLNNVDDVEAGTLLCNALVSFLPREGLSIRVDGLMEQGKMRLDGTIKSKIQEEPVTYFGTSWNPGGTEKWCVARTLFFSVVDGLKQRGWKQEYGYGDVLGEDRKKMYEGAFMVKGPIYIE